MTEERRSIEVGTRRVGAGAPPFLIAEVGQAHDGSLAAAHAYVDAAAQARADAVKFQVHLADAESTLDEPFRVQRSGADATRLDYWRRMQFSLEEWVELADHARSSELAFIVSGFSVAAVTLLSSSGVDAWKVGSGEFASTELFEAMAGTGRPVLLSTGMSTYAEIVAAISAFEQLGVELGVLQCTSDYPAPPERVGLNNLDLLRERTTWPVGLSDHSGSIWPSIVAAARGADIVEVHVVLDKGHPGPDTPASLTVDELTMVADAFRTISVLDEHPTDKDEVARDLAHMRETFGKSVATTRPLPSGHVLAAGDLTVKKPGTGIPRERLQDLVGRRLGRSVEPDRLLRWDDLEGEAG